METAGGVCRGSAWGKVDMLFKVVGGRDAEIGRAWGFWPRETSTERTCSVLYGHQNCAAGVAEGVCGLVSICGLRW
jgi:hypothetical protein